MSNRRPGYAILYGVLAVVCLAFTVFVGYLFLDDSVPALTEVTCVFDRYELDENRSRGIVTSVDLVLYPADGSAPYELTFYDGFNGTLPAPAFFCSGEAFTLQVAGDDIYAITGADGTAYVTVESKQAAYDESNNTAAVLVMVFFSFATVFMLVGIPVCLNPHRFPSWLVRQYIKPEALKGSVVVTDRKL